MIKDKNIPPEFPLDRIEREGSIKICINCGSTMTRSGFLKIFGELLCDNKKCPNSIKKYK